MDVINYLQAIILSIVEGITEFLPVSSTGHLIITNEILGISSNEFAKLFIIVIQFGAILSVVVLYWKKFFDFSNMKNLFQFYLKLAVAFIPIAIAGLTLKTYIHKMDGDVMIVGFALLLGGIFLLYFDKMFLSNEDRDDEEISYGKALMIGVFQAVAIVPGVSRSAATIVGGLSQKLKRKQAAEFSFFLAVPTMLAATSKDLLDNKDLLHGSNITMLIVGSAISFIVALLAIKFFIGYVSKNGFKVFGIYRIIVGIILLTLLFTGIDISIS